MIDLHYLNSSEMHSKKQLLIVSPICLTGAEYIHSSFRGRSNMNQMKIHRSLVTLQADFSGQTVQVPETM